MTPAIRFILSGRNGAHDHRSSFHSARVYRQTGNEATWFLAVTLRVRHARKR
jgi:hypothetical protein